MTREHRLIVGLEDLVALRWQCARCAGAVTFPLKREAGHASIRLPQLCPSRRERAVDQHAPNVVESSFHGFINALLTAIDVQAQEPGGGRLQFELVMPEDAATR